MAVNYFNRVTTQSVRRVLATWPFTGGLLAIVTVALGLCSCATPSGSRARFQDVGVAKIDITPDYPVRLTGYAVRKTESEGIAQHLWAKALALGSDAERPAILLTVDNCGVPVNVRDEVVKRLAQSRHIEPARVAICSSHTHSAPWLKGYLPNIFSGPIPAEQQARVERYTRELTDALVTVALAALENRQPSKLSRGKATANFAANRRTPGGPVDHELPVLFVTSPEGKLRALFASYACHCTTVTGEFNRICGDWSGYAQEALQREYPGAIALIALGCGGDSNPNPRPGFDLARRHGEEIAAAAQQAWSNSVTPVTGKLVCRLEHLELPLERLPTRAEWETLARQTNAIGKHAQMNLARLERGETLPTRVPYLVQTWTFGDELTMVFLAGEVVVDYSLRLKREFDPARIWVNAYANDVPCYIPSERVLKEGGYEGGGAMIYYDKPTRFAPGVENLIVSAVHRLVPAQFLSVNRKSVAGVPGA